MSKNGIFKTSTFSSFKGFSASFGSSLKSITISFSQGRYATSTSLSHKFSFSKTLSINSTFLFVIAFSSNSKGNFLSSSKICSSLAHVAGLSEITPQYSGILQANS
ncbi:MAG: hypothetical protein LBU14_04050 [Candidatus Peribacteria bacterium]|jgi:hypothetical protein|nr:hypothetical protein [Candidatus Peribacteria bacterium]